MQLDFVKRSSYVTNTTAKGFLLPLCCIKSSISQMCKQKILNSPTSFDFYKITTWEQMSAPPDKEGMFTLTRCWPAQLSEKITSSFYLPSAPSNYFTINLANSPLCYSCGWKRWLADVECSCKYVTYAITDSCHRAVLQLYETSRVQDDTQNLEVEHIFWQQKSHRKWMWNLEQVHSMQQQQYYHRNV
jgi:hypothetical protein